MRILLLDDDDLLARSIARVLKTNPAVTGVGMATTGAQARDALRQAEWDIVLVDELLDGESGCSFVAEVRDHYPKTRFLLVTGDPAIWLVPRSFQAGVDGYLQKLSITEELWTAIAAVLDGQIYVDPHVAGSVITTLAAAPRRARSPADGPSDASDLTPAEAEVQQALLRGLSNAQIAAERATSVDTVKCQLKSIFAKLGVSTREEAVLVARRRSRLRPS